MNTFYFLYKKGILSIAFGLLVVIGMIAVSFSVRNEDPSKMRPDNILTPPSVKIFQKLTVIGKQNQTNSLPEEIENKPLNNFSNPGENVENDFPFQSVVIDEQKNVSNESETFVFGTDHLGRSVYIRVASAAGTYLMPCFYSVVIALTLGIIGGTLSGYYYNSWIGLLAKAFLDAIRSIPVFVGIIIVMSATKINIMVIMVSFGVLVCPRIGTVVEQAIYSLRNNDFIVAAVEMGIPNYSIILKHILLYNCLSLLITQAAFTYAEAILIETSLGFLGIGSMGNDLSWGYMVKSGLSEFIIKGHLWVSLFPTLAILLNIFAFQSLGKGISKFFEYKSRAMEIN